MRCADRRWVVSLLALLALPASAAEIVLVVTDSNGIGFRDTRPADPAAGDNGAGTLGEQRLRAVERAAEIWAERLVSPVPIRIEIRMEEQACDADGTTLASAGPVDLAANFPNAPRANTNYHIAHANALSGTDASSRNNDIRATFNLSIDLGCSASTVGWWYGIDPEVPVPSDRVAMLPVALHELAHGLGFSASYNLQTGAHYGSHPPVWSNYLYDLQALSHWRTMSARDRASSARNDPHLVWTGNNVNRMIGGLAGDPQLTVTATRGRADPYTGLGLAEFGPAPSSVEPVEARLVQINDGIGAPFDGCQTPFVNGLRLAGGIALIDRGECTFVEKVRNAQAQGAIAAVIVNNADGPAPGMAGSDPSIIIPTVMVTRDEGRWLRARLSRPFVYLRLDRAETSSAVAQGCLRMYAPSELLTGSSVSHFHSSAFPDLLLEPSINRQLFDDLDRTLDLFKDIGWQVHAGVLDPVPPNNCVTGPLP